jgi:hypothetical protein
LYMSRSFYRVYAGARQKDAQAASCPTYWNFSELGELVDASLRSDGLDVVDFLAATMFCPNCKAEYREGFTHCADCDAELVNELPAAAIVAIEPVNPGDPVEDPFCSFWKGDDPRVHAELCELFGEQNIPYKTIRRQDHLFNWNTKSAFEIGIPFSQFDRAEAVVKDAYGGENEPASEEIAVPRELPESIEPRESRGDWDAENWYPEDASVRIWEGDQPEMGELLAASLRENQIHSRVTDAAGIFGLFVLPVDEMRAREIVREVIEGVPPE